MKRKEPRRILVPDESGTLTPVKLHEPRCLMKKEERPKSVDGTIIDTVFAGEYVKVYDQPVLAKAKKNSVLDASDSMVVVGEMVYSKGFERGTERQFVAINGTPDDIMKEYQNWRKKAKGRKYVNVDAETTPEELATTTRTYPASEIVLTPQKMVKHGEQIREMYIAGEKHALERSKRAAEELVRLQKQWKKEDAQEEKQYAKQGYKYVVDYWIHPASGASDKMGRTYFRNKPTEADIQKLLKNSVVKNDYKVKRITA